MFVGICSVKRASFGRDCSLPRVTCKSDPSVLIKLAVNVWKAEAATRPRVENATKTFQEQGRIQRRVYACAIYYRMDGGIECLQDPARGRCREHAEERAEARIHPQ